MQVYCDFDGTISVEDATDRVLSCFAEPEWEEIELEWKNGRIGSAECMRRQVGLIRASRTQLDALLDSVSIDPGFVEFLSFCAQSNLPVTVISDGVDYFIRRILARNGIGGLPVIANVLSCGTHCGQEVYSLSSPFSDVRCASSAGVCKCLALGDASDIIYIGDGRSDFCVANKPGTVFAKDRLAEYCSEQAIPFLGFQDFTDLLHTLKVKFPEIARPGPAIRQSRFA